MKKRALSLLIVGLVVALVGGATFAWFTDTEKATSNFTTGKVDIDLTYEGGENSGWVPNQSAVKEFTLKNNNNPAYVRIKITPAWVPADESALDSMLQLTFDLGSGWTLKPDGYYYLNAPMAKGQEIEKSFTIKLSQDAGNEYVDKSFKVDIAAEAVQSEYNTAPAWPSPVPDLE